MSDLIDRQAAIEWVNSLMDVQKYYHPHSKSTRFPLEEVIDVLQQVPSAQSNLQPTCNQLATDCISRQDAIDVLGVFTQADALGHTPKQIVEALPSAQRTGRWIVDDEFIDCSSCRAEKWSRTPYESLVKRFRFCPNCGAKMEAKEEQE